MLCAVFERRALGYLRNSEELAIAGDLYRSIRPYKLSKEQRLFVTEAESAPSAGTYPSQSTQSRILGEQERTKIATWQHSLSGGKNVGGQSGDQVAIRRRIEDRSVTATLSVFC